MVDPALKNKALAAWDEYIWHDGKNKHTLARESFVAGYLRGASEAPAAHNARLVEALKGVVRVADRNTAEFDAARAALSEASAETGGEVERLRQALRAIEALPRHSREDAAENCRGMQEIAARALASTERADEDGCYTLPNGDCVSEGSCIHSTPRAEK